MTWNRARVFCAIALTLSVALTAGPRVRAAASYDWLQFDFNSQHNGNNTSESILGPSNVLSLVQLFQVSLPSVADGAPAYLSNVATPSGTRDLLFLTTKDGHILALDAHNGSQVWSQQRGSTNYTTSSPAIDPNRQYVYSYGLDGYVHKYQVGTGAEVTGGGWPELATTKPQVEKSSPALSISTARSGATYLYVSNGGYPGDGGDYQGHVTTINLSTGSQHVFNTMCSNQVDVHFVQNSSPDCGDVRSAVWARPGVVYDPDTDRIYFATGNGTYDPGTYRWGDSVLALHADGTGASGNPLDSYTPTNQADLNGSDTDLGSTAPAIVPAPPGSRYSHLGVQGGKDGILRLLNLDSLSGQSGPGHTGGELSTVSAPGGEILPQPAVWVNPADGSTWVYVASGSLSAWQVVVDGSGNPSLVSRWQSGGGTSPIVANGVLYYDSGSGIRALNPVTGAQLWSSAVGSSPHWESPIVANGAVYITDENGNLTAFALPAPPPTAYTIGVEGGGQALYVSHSGGRFTNLGGGMLAAPAVVAAPINGRTQELYIVTGIDHRLYERTDGLPWQLLANGYCLDNPAATVSGKSLFVACQGGNHGLYYAGAVLPASGLPAIGGWTPFGGWTAYGPALTLVQGTPTAFVVGGDHRVYWRTAAVGWVPLGGWCIGHPAAATGGSTSYLACQGGGGALYDATNSGAGWGRFASLGGSVVDGPGIAATSTVPVFVIEGTDHGVYERTLTTGWRGLGGWVVHGAAAAAG